METAGESSVVLDMVLSSCGRIRGKCGEDLVQRRNGGVNMNALEDEGRQEAQCRFAGAVDDDVPFEHLGDNEFG